MALGMASPWRSRFEPSARTQEGAEAEDGDQRSARGRPGQFGSVRRGNLFPSPSWPGRRRASKSWSVWLVANNSTSIFFARPCDLPTRFRGQPRRVRDQLFALIKDLSAAEKSQGENETTSAPEKAIHEVQHLCQLAQLSRAGYYRHLAPREIQARRRRHSRCDLSHRTVRPLLRLSQANAQHSLGIAKQLKREELVVNSKRVRRLMRLDNLLSLRYKPFVPRTTDSAHGYEIVCDLTREACSLRRIISGSRTSPTSVWRRSSSIWRWSWTPSPGKSSAGRSPIICRPACRSRRSTRPSPRGAVR